MPRKRKNGDAVVATPDSEVTHVAQETAGATPERPAYIDGPPTAADGRIVATDEPQSPPGNTKNWGPPYKAIFTCSAKGFEMGENRRFKQRVFKFKDKPDAETIGVLKDNGFTYRPEEKTWTIQANNASRQLADELAAKFAGESNDIAR